ncbi:MAG: extracellular solute-binding protein [Clostridiaceae bacterium]|nr:extracellular solute-binding protein [Clostridiaceae bacterium]
MKAWIICMMLTLLILLSSTGCSTKTVLDPQKPVTLTMWHNYGGQMKNLMDEMIDEFNRTVGADQGIIINVTSISGSSALHDKLISAAYGDPGAPEFPDLAVVYPKTALKLAEKDLLADLSDRFTGEELSAYVPRFVEEGKIKGGLFVFPIAKSTEVLFVNRSIFDRFAADTGAAYDDLSTFEGIIRTADKYYEWSEGKAFYMPDSVFNLALIGMAQLGEDFVQENRLNMASGEYKKIWDGYFLSAVKGSTAIFDGYSTDLFKTGDVICSTGSTAGTLFYPDTVTYTDNTKENAEYAILPYPVFEGGKKVALQRGGGMCVIKSSGQKEIAAAVFLKWFTAPEQNLHFTASSGYLPVTEEAFGNAMSRQMEGISEENIKKLLSTAMVMQEEYDFFIPPLTDNYDELQKGYEVRLKKAAKAAKAEFDALAGAAGKAAALETLSKNVYEDFIK